GLDGKLLGAPLSKSVDKQNFDFPNCRLPTVKLGTWGGWIFVNFDPDSPSLTDYLAIEGTRKYGDLLRPEDTVITDEYTFELDCNWKFVPENLSDFYHVKVVHSQSFGKHFPDDPAWTYESCGRVHAEYEAFTMAPDGISLFGPMPWLKESRPSPTFACAFYVQ